MIRLAAVIDTHEASFLAKFGEQMNADQRWALKSIRCCRGATSPLMQVQCVDCPHSRLVPHSCGHRLCPHCQHHESQQWLERQMQRLVPADYFLLTFTLPAEFRGLTRTHADVVLGLVMRSAWDTVRTFSQNDRQMQGTPGAIAVLHTHSRRLDFHPHVHLVVPAAAVDGAKGRWRRKRRGKNGTYLFNAKALAKVFRAKMLAALTAAGISLPERYPEEWVADCKSVGTGQSALIYLGRYLYRGVIREEDILHNQNGRVTFRYRCAKTGKREKRTLDGADFLWLILQHVLPRGFRRARNFGFLHPNCKRLITLLHLLLKFDPARFAPLTKPRPPVRCPNCGGVMWVVKTRIRPPPNPGPLRPVAAVPTCGVLF